MKWPFRLFPAVISAALAAAVITTTGCGVQKEVNAAGGTDVGLSSNVASEDVSSSLKAESVPQKEEMASAEVRETDRSYLDDAVFIGDSVTLKLQKYVTSMRKKDKSFFGKARFLAAGSMGSGNALQPLGGKSIHPYYNGEKALLEDSIAKMSSRKVYIMFGMNDIAVYGIDGSAENLKKLSARIIEKTPGIKIYIQSVTPILKSKQKHTLNNANIEIYNNKLKEICKHQSWYYIDVASVMHDGSGSLKPEYCSDPDDLGIHFTDKACSVWVHYILTHAPTEE